MGCSGSKKSYNLRHPENVHQEDLATSSYANNSDDANVAVAALQKAFLDGQISAVVYEQACAGLANNNNNNK